MSIKIEIKIKQKLTSSQLEKELKQKLTSSQLEKIMLVLTIVSLLVQYLICGQVEAQTPLMIDRSLLDAIKQVESGGDPCAIGDNGRSLGAYQIMEAYYSDALQYNPRLGDGSRTYTDVWGIGSEAYSEEVISSYMGRYATPQRLGGQPTDEEIARIHNGGPNGFRRNTTLPYWVRVMTELARQRSGRQTQGGNNQCSPACSAGQCCSTTGNCNCLLSQTFTVQPCMESGSNSVHGQVYVASIIVIAIVFSAIFFA